MYVAVAVNIYILESNVAANMFWYCVLSRSQAHVCFWTLLDLNKQPEKPEDEAS